jgi:hypothetical protein
MAIGRGSETANLDAGDCSIQSKDVFEWLYLNRTFCARTTGK